jgi:hypothetical protein
MRLSEGMSQSLEQLAMFNPAGGVKYHLRARRHSKLWEPFRWSLGEWLLGWAPPERQLVLVGPSAGYNLQPFLFERFERVVVLEPDPIARWLFNRRLLRAPLERRPRVEFITSDHLVQHPERLRPLLERVGSCAILFSNVLGQIVNLLDADPPGSALDAVRSGVRAALTGRSFASFHDRVSGPVPPSVNGVFSQPRRWSDAEVLKHAYAAADSQPRVELDDHHTDGFFPEDLPHSYLRWEFEPGLYHLVEAVAAVQRVEPPARTDLPGAPRQPLDPPEVPGACAG